MAFVIAVGLSMWIGDVEPFFYVILALALQTAIIVLVETWLRRNGATIFGRIEMAHHGGTEATERENKNEVNDEGIGDKNGERWP
jgi:hypothetical protein